MNYIQYEKEKNSKLSDIYNYHIKYCFVSHYTETSIFLLFAPKIIFCSLRNLFYFCDIKVQKYES